MKNTNRKGYRYRGPAVWAVVLSDIFIVCGVPLFFYNVTIAMLVEIAAVICFIISIAMTLTAKQNLQRSFYDLIMNNDSIQSHIINEMQIPYAIVNRQGDILWQNEAFTDIGGGKKRIGEIFPELNRQKFRRPESHKGINVQKEDTHYRVVPENMNNIEETGELVKEFLGSDTIWGLAFYDETEIAEMRQELAEQKNMVCLLYLDNYEEALENVEQVRQSILTALIERKITRSFQQYDALLQKLEKDKYLAVIKQKHFEDLKASHFAVLEDVKNVNIGNEQSITVSIGLGLNGGENVKNYEYARTAIDMALARGGDQAVVKDGVRIQYFGGRSQKAEKNTRVKARMKAHALAELVRPHEQVFIMGHHLSDIDCLGAAIGMFRAMESAGKSTHIVLNEVIASVKPFYDNFKSSEYPEDLFINGEEALELLDEDAVLIIVDTNRRTIVEEKKLVDKAKTIVVMDHHRQVSDYIADAQLSYVEPFASSACEMVAEILQYFADGEITLRPYEADALYGGIVVDTHNFTVQTGVRTFEAAAYLRKSGADIARIRKLLRDDWESYKIKSKAINSMEIIEGRFAITVCPPVGESPTVLAAETANDLLSIKEIQASFVLTEFDSTVYISARSIDEVNVQVIMERLGGGGHMSIAGAQLKGANIDDAKELVKETIELMIEEGEL